MKISPTLMYFLLPSHRTLFFAIKGIVAVSLALAISLHLDLEKPFWAVVASMMLQARPETGLVIEKATFLFLGSIAGAVLAMLILDSFSAYRGVAIFCLVISIATTAMLSSTVRHVNFIFGFTLISVTATLIVLFSMADPINTTSHNIFHIIRARISEVMVGASSAALVSLVLFPFKVEKTLKTHVHNLMSAVLSHLASVLSAEGSSILYQQQKQAIIVLATTINGDSNAGRYEDANNIKPAIFMANKALSLLAFSQGIEQIKRDHPETIDSHLEKLLIQIGIGLKSIINKPYTVQIETLKITALTLTDYIQQYSTAKAIQYFILKALTQLLTLLNEMLDALYGINNNKKFPIDISRFSSYRDPIVGGVSAIRSVLVFVSCVGVWVVSGGTTVLVMMMVLPILFSQMFANIPNPQLVAKKILIGSLFALPVAIYIGLSFLAQGIGSYEILILILSGPLFVGLMAMLNANTMPYGLGFCLSFVVLIQPSNNMAFAVDQTISQGLGLATGLAFLYLSFQLIGSPKGLFLQSRIIKAIAKDLSVAGAGHHLDQWFNRRIAERLFYLANQETSNKYSNQMTEWGLLGLYLGHISLLFHHLLAGYSTDDLQDFLIKWRVTLAKDFLNCVQASKTDLQLKTMSAELLDRLEHNLTTKEFTLAENVLEHIWLLLNHMRNVHKVMPDLSL